MQEMRFICKDELQDEYISLKTMCICYGKTKDEMLKIGYDIGNKKTFKIDGFEYEVVLPHGNNLEVRQDNSIPNVKKKRTYYTKVEHKKTGEHNRRLFITNVIMNTKGTTHKRKYYINGKVTTVIKIAEILEITPNYLEQKLARVKKATINGYDIRIRNHLTKYKPVKDGKEYRRRSIKECSELSGIVAKTVTELHRKGTYSTKDGWRFL